MPSFVTSSSRALMTLLLVPACAGLACLAPASAEGAEPAGQLYFPRMAEQTGDPCPTFDLLASTPAGTERPLLEVGACVGDTEVSPDGRVLAVDVYSVSPGYGVKSHRLALVDAFTGERADLSWTGSPYVEHHLGDFAWEPDGSDLTAVVPQPGPYYSTSSWTITTLGLDGHERQVLHNATSQVSNLRWSPAGDRLFFAQYESQPTGDGDSTRVAVLKELVPGGVPVRVSPTAMDLDWVAVSPDGTRVAYSRVGQPGYYVAPLDFSSETPLPSIDTPSRLVWSPDGAWLAFSGGIVRADGSELRSLPGMRSLGAWGPDATPRALAATAAPAVVDDGQGSVTARDATWETGHTVTRAWFEDGVRTTYPPVTDLSPWRSATSSGPPLAVRSYAYVPGYSLSWVTSPPTTPLVGSNDPPAITGTARVGKGLTSSPGRWSPAEGLTLRRQWFRGTTAIPGATGVTYTVQPADLGRRLSVRVIASRPGYVAGSATSAPTAVVAPGTFTVRAAASVIGTLKVGYLLTANPPLTAPAPATISYQWLRNGYAIRGATYRSYRLSSADRGKRIGVRITLRRAGYTPLVRTIVRAGYVA